jgi:uncharacterized protein (TIGR01777 family)
MNIIVTGGTGFVGSALLCALTKRGDRVVILTRNPKKSSIDSNIAYVVWNPQEEQSVVKEIDGAHAIINLAGEPLIGKRWSAGQKVKILASRVSATQIIAHSIKQAVVKPKVLINASAIGYYGSRENESLTEESSAGTDFLTDVCKAWEAHAVRVEDFNVRVVRLRIGIVLDKKGGALKLMLPPFRLGAGGWLGNGNQWMSWISREDLVRLIVFCLDNAAAKGALNAVSPQPVNNKAFSLVLAQVLKRPCFAPVPEFMLKLLLGEMSQVLLGSQRVVPKKAMELGFSYHHAEIRHALESITH